MDLTLLLPWFPILLAVGVGGRLLGRRRATALGALCALFWIVLMQASVGAEVWSSPFRIAAVAAGAAAIVAMAAWSGDVGAPVPKTFHRPGPIERNLPSAGLEAPSPAVLADAMDQFDDWLEDHRDDTDPWPRFDEFIRGVMYQACRATHVRPYRCLSEGDDLLPLREADPYVDVQRVSARHGIVGHVVTTGRSYIAGDETQGELVHKLAEDSDLEAAWCFAIARGARKIGVVVVGQLDVDPLEHRALLRSVERMICQFWGMLIEACRSRSAALDDPVSTLLTREAFVRIGETTLSDSYRLGEPVAVAVIALEGLRQLHDGGRWESADELIREASSILRHKVRADDLLGRFDGSRFLVLLRRVDSELARLILNQLMARLTTMCGDAQRWRAEINARCGLAGSGMEQPGLRDLISRAVAECHRARAEHLVIASDLAERTVLSGAGS